ncbi:cell division protein ZipA C-terminal FtsZ-binding domain-containing protein [Jeongeupia chitinilytica]|uniref:Cell division protein ZipA n=1 Tax=Jeongeupia chitinilytica TaxID=1041641 RepID=A0ABQ3GYD4_9NEIS|nr:cell division protein ZipA C-terminal FtsZ-binding domain-containing protein [Jeongeupia chitinilytica]GHD61118.1 cell division protein ZipA [Jeongeupia chitinilytica]
MTDLQLGSLIAGGAIVAAVYAFNWWQEHRYRKQAQRAFAQNQPDVLLETQKNMVRPVASGQRLEPMIEPVVPAAPVRREPQLDVPEVEVDDDLPAFDDVAEAPVRVPEPVVKQVELQDVEVLATSQLDASLDFIADIHANEPIAAAEVPQFSASKRVVVLGLTEAGQWEVVSARSNGRYTELRAGLQLADRQGSLTQEQLNAFCMAVQQFADEHEAVVTFPQRSGKLAAARDLDEFCASVDVLIGLNVVTQGKPFPMERVRLFAEQAGLARGADGLFHYRSESGKALFSLVNQDQSPFGNTSEGLTFLFDVPRVAGGLPVFDHLSDIAQQLANLLAGDLVDDSGRPLAPGSIANIRRQLTNIYAQMDDRGIAPGSMAALRLFA